MRLCSMILQIPRGKLMSVLMRETAMQLLALLRHTPCASALCTKARPIRATFETCWPYSPATTAPSG